MRRVLFFAWLAGCALLAVGFAGIAVASHPATSEYAGQVAGPAGGTATPTACVTNYACSTTASATIVPGTTDIGNHCDDCITTIALPFTVQLYGTSYNSAHVSSNGNVQLASTDIEFTNTCLPIVTMGPTIFAYWEDLVTEGANCTGGCGIYTSVSGTAPNRIFNIEWRTFYFSEPGNAYFEIRLYEATPNFDVILGTLNTTATSSVGVQNGVGGFTQCLCNTQPPTNSKITFTASTGTCGTPFATFTPGTATGTPTSTLTGTAIVATSTGTGVAATATRTATAVVSGTPIVATASSTPAVSTVTGTPQASATAIASTATGTAAVATSTAAPSSTSAPVPPTSSATPCTVGFTDVPPSNTFYPQIRCLACRGIMGGYSDHTFRPNNDITRGQLSKIVANSAGFNEPVTAQTFEDVEPDNTFYAYIGRMASRGIIGGYPCGGTGEPCGTTNRPYFRPNANATRGQISKIVSEAAGYNDVPEGQTY
ncbi:MAG TPA: S-layer homology domain-containing protein, partial [Chloroflexia bacterium]